MYRVFLKASAKKELDTFPPKTRVALGRAIEDLVHLGIHAKQVKKLQLPLGGYRMRVGDYRILFDRKDEIIVIHRISKRADAY